MKGLIRKDLDWLLTFALAGLVVGLGVFFSNGYRSIWWNPVDWLYQELIWVWWVGGIALGFFAAIREDLYGTRDFLRHRPVSTAQIFWVRVAACCAVIASWLVVPPLLHGAMCAMTMENIGGERWDKLITYPLAGTAAFATFGAGHFAGTLRTHWVLRVIAFGLAGLTTVMIASWLAAPSAGAFSLSPSATVVPASLPAYALAMVALAALFLWAARRNDLAGADADRPLPQSTVRPTAVLVALVTAGAFTIAAEGIQWEIHSSLISDYPRIVETENGEVVLAVSDYTSGPGGGRRLVAVDADHVRGEEVKGTVLRGPWGVVERHRPREPILPRIAFGGPWWRLDLPKANGWVDQGTGIIHVYGHDWYGTIERPDGPFSSVVRELWTDDQGWADHSETVIADHGDGTLWRIGADPLAGVTRLALPDGDKFTGRLRLVGSEALAVAGERGEYMWRDGEFEVLPADMRVDAPPPQSLQVEVVDADSIAPLVRVVDGDGAVRLEHHYGPKTFGELATAGGMFAWTVLRPPLSNIVSFALPASAREGKSYGSFVDQFLVEGQRWWLLVIALAFGAWMAVATRRRAQRLGVERSRVLFWTVLVAATGIPGWLAFRVLETRRGYGAVVVDEGAGAERRGLLITSA